jgi:hypothetical protein
MSDGQPLHFRRDYLKHGIREHVEDVCTRQIGYRTGLDAAEAERREIGEYRFTSLDRAILRGATPGAQTGNPCDMTVVKDISEPGLTDWNQRQGKHIVARLAVLQRMGLAETTGPHTWVVRRDLETVMRAMQRAADRQRMLAAHGLPISDDRLPIAILDWRTCNCLEGRILVHGQDEQSGQHYLMLEGTDAKIHFVGYTHEMDQLRAAGGLRVNSFLRLRRRSINAQTTLDVEDMGNAEKVLTNRVLLAENARALLNRGITPSEDGWGGWLGKYQSALAEIGKSISQSRTLQDAASGKRRRAISRER